MKPKLALQRMQLLREFSPNISFPLIIAAILLSILFFPVPMLLTVSSSSLSPIQQPSFHFSSICCHYSWLPTYFPTRRLRHRILAACHDPRVHAASSLLEGDDFFDELSSLLVLLPYDMRRRLEKHSEITKLIEVVMDLGRPPLARFPSGDFVLSDRAITSHDLIHATSQASVETLHRISAIRNRKGAIVGLTCRVGRAVQGSANMLRDLVMDGDSLLLIGPPGVGKTTIIRDIARMLADDYRKRVMIVDTSNEIGGDGDIPHTGIGNARRMQVPNSDVQHKVLIEAVENHMPQVIVIDEIGTKLEAMAASTIAQRGIQLVATAHGVTVENLIMNPSLEMLVGGIQNVTLGDEEASRRGVQKTVLERKGPSTFTRGAEIISKTEIQVHHNLESTVDALLAGRSPNYEVRKFDPNRSTYEMLPVKMEPSNELSPHVEEFVCVEENSLNNNEMISSSNSKFNLKFAETLAERSADAGICIRIFVYGIAETSALQAIKQLGMNEAIGLTDNISEADAFLAMHSKLKKNSHIEVVAKSRGIPMHAIKTSSLMQLRKAVRTLINEHVRGFRKPEAEEVASTLQKADFSGAISELPVLKANASFTDKHGTGFEAPEFENKLRSLEEMDALEETRLAIEEVVIPKEEQVLLLPRSPTIISKQIKLIESYNLKWVTNGEDPHVSLCVLPFSLDKKEGKSYYVDYESEVNNLLGTYDNSNSQNEVARLPLLPE